MKIARGKSPTKTPVRQQQELTLLLENVRCFYGRHEIPLRPLTLLVGENSSGKTTILSMLAALSRPGQSMGPSHFNTPPYELGNFATIASTNGAGKQADHFVIGLRTGNSEVAATYVELDGQPRLRRALVSSMKFLESLADTRSLAPVRTKPRRTYDALTEDFKPEGDHIPLLLSRIWAQKDKKRRAALLEALQQFGTESGLFQNLDVRQLGDHVGDPFQLQVTIDKRPTNILDVGYGVSQSLPIVVETVLAAKQQRILLQQPEVHLHPRAQAALGSFFVSLVASGERELIVETHSDHLLDRVRLEIARGRISKDAVQILFCDRQGAQARVYPIHLDAQGNVIDPPPNYRSFFLEEELNLLTRAEAPPQQSPKRKKPPARKPRA